MRLISLCLTLAALCASPALCADVASDAAMSPSSSSSSTFYSHTARSEYTGIPALGWVFLAAVVAGSFAFSYTLSRWYTDKYETEAFPFTVTVIAIAVSLVSLFLIPLDVYMAGSGVEANAEAVRYTYYVMYVVIALFLFFLLPFAYFFYEEEDENATAVSRSVGACKYTVFLVIIALVLFIIGALLKPNTDKELDLKSSDARQWARALLTPDPTKFSISFCISCLILLGFLCWVTYTAYGLFALPIDMIRGKRKLREEEEELEQSIAVAQERKRAINAKYVSGKKVSKKDAKQIALLRRQERVLARKGERIADQARGCNRVLYALRPFTLLFGIAFFALSLLFFFSLTATQIDRIAGATLCAQCGFILQNPWLYNPLDTLLWLSADFFPLDLILFTLLILYVLFVTLAGIVKVGIRVLWVQLYPVRRRSTAPQALIMMAGILMLSLVTLTSVLLTFAPQYTSYGGQHYIDTTSMTEKKCTIDAPAGVCHMTQVAELMNTVALNYPFFSSVYYVAIWVVLGMSAIFAVYGACCKEKRSSIDEDSSDDEW